MANLFEQLGGDAAVDTAVDLFYRKILADNSVRHFFIGTDMDEQRAKQKKFLNMAFGGPEQHTGKSLRDAHKHLVDQGMNGEHFDTVVNHLKATLYDLGITSELTSEVIKIAQSTRDDILNL